VTGEARQRWRVVFRREAAAAQLGGRDLQAAIEANLAAAGLPTAGRTQMAAGLPSGLAAERELLDVTLTERWPVARVRPALGAALPDGHEIVDCHDVWLGEPALAAQARSAEYRIVIEGESSAARLRGAATALLASDHIARTRLKGDRTVDYDLRPLLEAIDVDDDGPPVVLRVRVRIDQERGPGRPDEVVAALGAELGSDRLRIATLTRLCISIASDPAPARA
jgi:radical SAM-linked protein